MVCTVLSNISHSIDLFSHSMTSPVGYKYMGDLVNWIHTCTWCVLRLSNILYLSKHMVEKGINILVTATLAQICLVTSIICTFNIILVGTCSIEIKTNEGL